MGNGKSGLGNYRGFYDDIFNGNPITQDIGFEMNVRDPNSYLFNGQKKR